MSPLLLLLTIFSLAISSLPCSCLQHSSRRHPFAHVSAALPGSRRYGVSPEFPPLLYNFTALGINLTQIVSQLPSYNGTYYQNWGLLRPESPTFPFIHVDDDTKPEHNLPIVKECFGKGSLVRAYNGALSSLFSLTD